MNQPLEGGYILIKQTRFRKGVTAVGLLCLFAQGCGPKSVQSINPRTPRLKTSSKSPKSPYGKVKPAQISKYLKTVFRSSQANRIREIGKEPADEMSVAARKIAARIEQEPENLELTKQLAHVLIREGHLVEAFSTLDRVRSLPATDPEIEGGLALVWHKLGSTSSALYHAQQAVLLDRSAANLALLGKIQLQRADYGNALVTLKEAHFSHPDSQSLTLGLARAAVGARDWEAARSYFERTLELNPECLPAGEGLATALVRLDEVNDAFTELRRLFDWGEAYARLGQELASAERWGEAQKALRKALEYSPEDRELSLKLATVDSYLPFPTVAFLKLGNGIAIDEESITLQPAHSVVELRGSQVSIGTAELEPAIGADRASGEISPSEVVDPSIMDAVAELRPYSHEPVEKEVFRRYVSPNVVELVELPMESRDPVVSLVELGSASPLNLSASQTISPGLHEVADTAAATGWGGAELAQLPLSASSQVIQPVNGRFVGTVVVSGESVAPGLSDTESLEDQEIRSWEMEMEMEVARVRSVLLDSPTQTTSDAREVAGLNPARVLDEQVTVSVPEESSRSAEAAREAVPGSTPAGPDKHVHQVETQPGFVQSLLETWGIPVEEASEGVSLDLWQTVGETGRSRGNLPVEPPPEEAEEPAETENVAKHVNLTEIRKLPMSRVSLLVFESVLDESGTSLTAEAEIVEVEADAVDEGLAPALEAQVTEADNEYVTLAVIHAERTDTPVRASDVPPDRVDPKRQEASPLPPDLLCRLQGFAPASRAILINDSLMEEDFRQEGWPLSLELNGVTTAEITAGAARNQFSTLWLPLTGLAVLALLGFLLRRREPAAQGLERNSEKRS